jgi:hypothetical protein
MYRGKLINLDNVSHVWVNDGTVTLFVVMVDKTSLPFDNGSIEDFVEKCEIEVANAGVKFPGVGD